MNRLQDSIDQVFPAEEHFAFMDGCAGNIRIEPACAQLLTLAKSLQQDGATECRNGHEGGGKEPGRLIEGPGVAHRIVAARGETLGIRCREPESRVARRKSRFDLELGDEEIAKRLAAVFRVHLSVPDVKDKVNGRAVNDYSIQLEIGGIDRLDEAAVFSLLPEVREAYGRRYFSPACRSQQFFVDRLVGLRDVFERDGVAGIQRKYPIRCRQRLFRFSGLEL